MSDISAAQVKELRDRTGAGMMDCKKALAATVGNIDEAIQWLRTKGLAAAAKKAGRVAAEGLVAVAVDETAGAIVEVNSETDFVARNETFQELTRAIAKAALSAGGDYEVTTSAAYPGGAGTVTEAVNSMVGTIGENLRFRRSTGLKVEKGMVAHYIHSTVVPGMGKIAVLVALESEGDAGKLAELGKQLAMHVAATSPQSVTVAGLDPAVVERERKVYSEQAKESGKPDNIAAKMVEGRLRKFYGEAVLMEQLFVMNNETKVEKAIEEVTQEIGAPIVVTGFARFALGEGIEKREDDFVTEVLAAQGN